MTASCDVIVVGGGPVGAACARELALAGRRVLVLEPGGDMGQGWRAAAGMLAPQIEANDGGSPARARPRRTRAVLVARPCAARDDGHRSRSLAGGHRVGRGQRGGGRGAAVPMRVAAPARAPSPTGSMPRKCRRAGPGSGPTAARSGPPAKAPSSQGSWSTRCSPMPCGSARSWCRTRGTALDQRGDRIVGVIGRSGRYAAGEVVIAAGAWSGTVEGLPRPLAVAPVRGQDGRASPGRGEPAARSSTVTAATSWPGATRRSSARRWSMSASAPR